MDKFNNGVEVQGIKPVVDGVVYHTRYQAHNIITDEVTECADLAQLVEVTTKWEEPSNAINWYEVVYKGNKANFTPDDLVHSAMIQDCPIRNMVYSLRSTLLFNKALLDKDNLVDVVDLEEEHSSTVVTLTVVMELEGDVSKEIETYDPATLLREALDNKHHVHELLIDDVAVKEVF